MKRNPRFAQLKTRYLFPEIQARKRLFQQKHPAAALLHLGIGDTTEPIPLPITEAFAAAAARLSTTEGYSGYGDEQGLPLLRQKISSSFYGDRVAAADIFISDGAKCDIGRLQLLFGPEPSLAIQDPAYPVYVEGSLIQGVEKVHMMPCLPERGFFPDLQSLPPVDLLYFCSPNNPTGAVATRKQLTELVSYARAHKTLIIYDAAYACYIQDPALPSSIYEIEGAEEVAIEISSFSKIAGFTGVRLGWTVVPEALRFSGGESVKADFNRVITTIFNGASNLAQWGGVAALEPKGAGEVKKLIHFYLENARILKRAFENLDHPVYGGENAPYLWVHFPGFQSWDLFQFFLEECHLVVTPGAGFGPSGEGFIRLSAFGRRNHILEAAERIKSPLRPLF